MKAAIRMPAVLLGTFLVIWSGLAVAPLHRADWLLENLIVFVAVPTLAWSYRRLPFSNGSYLAIFAFLVLHAIGSHYTYSEVPVERWGQAVFGFSIEAVLGIDRNHYDRVVHFAYGLLITPAAIELIDARSAPTRFWRWILVVSFITAHGALYELVEWAAAMVFAEDLRMAYLGAQGDVWDAQKDILLGSLGSALTATVLRRRASGRHHCEAAGQACPSSTCSS